MLVALALPLAAFAQERKPDELLFGSVAMDIPAVMYQRLKPLTDYLASELKRPVRLKLAPDMSKAISDVATGSVDIAYLTPVAYIKAQKAGQVRLVAKTITKGEESFRLMVVVRHDSPIKQVKDLAGKSFAFGDEAAILQRAVVVNAGVPIEQLGSYKYLGHYDNIARGVANGDFDAGILKDTTAFQWEKKGLRILHTSPALPPYNIAVSSRVDDATLRALQDALVKLNPANPENLRIIKVLDQSYDGFAATHDAEYDVVRQLIKPFQK
jgi:phosphonate transport system substrate-binding protein